MATLRPTFTWQPVTPTACGGLTYEIQLDDSCAPGALEKCAFASPEVDATMLVTPSYTPSLDLKVTSSVPVGAFYAWRVRACEGNVRCSPWSEVRYLHVGRVREDINGDGYGDLLGWNGDGLDVYTGSAQFDASAPSAHIVVANFSSFGATFVGDVNGDGFGDFLAMDNYQPTAGAIPILFYGGASLSSLHSLVMTKTAGGPSTIVRPRPAGDFNGDGYADLMVHWGYQDSSPKAQLRVFFGGPTISTDPDLTIPGPYDNWEGFTDSGRVGDVDGDGYEDIAQFGFAIGSSAPAEGMFQVFLGGRSPDVISDLDITTAQAPGTLSPAGDTNGDGYDDVLLLVGSTYGLLSGASPFMGLLTPSWTDSSASSILGGFDLDGNHLTEFAVGRTNGTPLLYLGGIAPVASQTALSFVSGSPATFSDHDGDGRPDLVFVGTNVEWAGSDGTLNPRPQQIFGLVGDVVR